MHPYTARMIIKADARRKALEKLPVWAKSIHAKRNIMRGLAFS